MLGHVDTKLVDKIYSPDAPRIAQTDIYAPLQDRHGEGENRGFDRENEENGEAFEPGGRPFELGASGASPHESNLSVDASNRRPSGGPSTGTAWSFDS